MTDEPRHAEGQRDGKTEREREAISAVLGQWDGYGPRQHRVVFRSEYFQHLTRMCKTEVIEIHDV